MSIGYGVVMSSLVWPQPSRLPFAYRRTCSEARWMSSPVPEAPLVFAPARVGASPMGLSLGSFHAPSLGVPNLYWDGLISPKISGISHSLQGGCAFFSYPAEVSPSPADTAPGLSAEPLIRRQPRNLRSAFGGPYFCRAPESVAPPCFCPAADVSTSVHGAPGVSWGHGACDTRGDSAPPFSPGPRARDTHAQAAGSF